MLFNLLSSTNKNTGGNYVIWVMLAFLVLILGVMMFVQNRSNKKRQKEAEEKLNSLRIGDRVKTIGGICGIIVEINDDENTFVLETGVENSGNFIKFDKIAIYQSSHPEDEVAQEVEEVKPEAEETTEEQPATEEVKE